MKKKCIVLFILTKKHNSDFDGYPYLNKEYSVKILDNIEPQIPSIL
jgi:hypothetical protein